MIVAETPPSESTLRKKTPVSSAEVEALLSKLVTKLRPGDDHRKSQRRPVAIAVPVIPVDEEGNPVGAPYLAMSRDISSGGICLIHTRATTSKFLLVELRAPRKESMKLLVEVVRCRSIGRTYEIGGKFLSKITDRPADAVESTATAMPTSGSDSP